MNGSKLGGIDLQIRTHTEKKQEGPKGPGSLTSGKGQRSQWSHLQRTTNVVHQILVEDL